MTTDPADPPAGSADRSWTDLAGWLVLAAAGLGVTALAVYIGARLGTASAPFLGRYRVRIGPLSLLAPAVATGVLAAGLAGWLDRLRWGVLLAVGWLAGLAWALALALTDGTEGLTRSLVDADTYASDVAAVDDHPLRYLADYVRDAQSHSFAARGHPPGAVLLLWGLGHLGVHSALALGVLVTALGTLAVPAVLYAVGDVCGHPTARLYLPVLVLAPYAIWVAVSVDGVEAALGALAVAAGVRASGQARRGWSAAGWSVACGMLLGIAGMVGYAVVWLGLSVVLLYFARRRPFLNVGTGLGALVPIVVVNRMGFDWLAGIAAARSDFTTRIEPHRSALWWSLISLATLVLACGPALYASARKIRNTPAWPFLVGSAIAVLFSLAAGLARGGAEAAWLPFFPWLTVAAVAPERPGGDPPPPPWPLVAGGAVTAVIIEALLATPW